MGNSFMNIHSKVKNWEYKSK